MKIYSFLLGSLLCFSLVFGDESVPNTESALDSTLAELDKELFDAELLIDSLENSLSEKEGDTLISIEVIKREEIDLEKELLKVKIQRLKEEHEREVLKLKKKLKEKKEKKQKATVYHIEKKDDKKGKKRGAFIWGTRILSLENKQVRKLIPYINDFNNKNIAFNFTKKRALMLDYTGLMRGNNGFRLGGTFFVGYKKYQSNDFLDSVVHTTTVLDGDSLKDIISVTVENRVGLLRHIPVGFGLTGEKVFPLGQFSIVGGFSLAGGADIVIKSIVDKGVFINSDSFDDEDSWDDVEVSVAPSIYGDLFIGGSIQLTRWFAFGIDGVLHLSYAYNGYGNGGMGSGDFSTVSPGIRFKFYFGKSV